MHIRARDVSLSLAREQELLTGPLDDD